jgi:hypothetical protein
MKVLDGVSQEIQRLAEFLECTSTQGNAIYLGLIIRWCPVRIWGGLPIFVLNDQGLREGVTLFY